MGNRSPWEGVPSQFESAQNLRMGTTQSPTASRCLRRGIGHPLRTLGMPDAVVMALVGHESSAMSHRYTHVGKEALARAAKLPEI